MSVVVHWYHRLDVRVLLGLICVLVVFFGMFFYQFHQWQTQTIRDRAQAQSEAVAHTMMASLKTLMLAGDAESVQDWLTRLRMHPELKSVEVVRRDGTVAFRDLETVHRVNHFLGSAAFSRQSLDSLSVQGLIPAEIMRAAGGEMVVKQDFEHQRITLLLPIGMEKSCLACHGYEHNPVRGLLRITTSTAAAMAHIQQAEERLLTMVILGALLIAVILFMLLRSTILTPIVRLYQATRALSLGGIGTQVPVRGQGEVRALMASFNEMSTQLQDSTVSNDFMEAILHALGEMLFVTDGQGIIQISNQQACKTLGYSMDQLHGRDVASLLAVGAHDIDFKHSQRNAESTLQSCDGRLVPVAIFTDWVPAQSGEADAHLVHVVRDLSQQKESERELRLAAKVMETVPNAIMVADKDANVCLLNPAFSAITGYEMDEMLGKNPNVLSSGRHSKAFYSEMWHQILEEGGWAGEIWNKRKDGTVFPEYLIITVMRDDAGEINYYVSTFLDISEQKKLEYELRHSAQHDALTGLPNRLLLSDRLDGSLSRGRRLSHKVAVLFIDIDGFKPVNDTMGHDAGDVLLQQISERLRSCVRESDTVARVGGDEFVIILENQSDRKSMLAVVQKILNVIRQPFDLSVGECLVGASIGLSVFPDDGKDPNELLKQADTAMYVAKEGGKNRAVFYDEITMGEDNT